MKRLIDIATTHITRLVPIRASAWDTSDIRRRNGGEGMNCSQNSTPAMKKLPCISQMCTVWFSAARSNRAGTCQRIITALNKVTETHGRSRKAPVARSGRDQLPRSVLRVTAWPVRPGRPSSSGCHGAPGDHQGRRGEHQQQVLEHVHEEVVVGPVVDGRRDGEQQHRQAAVEQERPPPPLASALRPGPPGEPGQADFMPDHQDRDHDQERVERPVTGEIAHDGAILRGLPGPAPSSAGAGQRAGSPPG